MKNAINSAASFCRSLTEPTRSPGLSNSCNRAKIFEIFNSSIHLADQLPQQLRKPRYLDVQATSDHNHVYDISLSGPRANWALRNGIVHTLRLFKLSAPRKAENFHSSPGVRRTVKSSTAAVVAGSLHPDEKPLSAELHRPSHCRA